MPSPLSLPSLMSSLPCHPVGEPAPKAQPKKRFSVELGETRPAGPPVERRPAGPLSATPLASAAEPAPAAKQALTRLLADEKAVEQGLARALAGGAMSPKDLLTLQVQVIRYSQELEVASRLVEKVSGAVKQTLQSQV